MHAWLRDRMIVVGVYGTRADAESAQGMLAADGIPSLLQADDAGGAYPFDLSGGSELLVELADAEHAAAILGEPPPCTDHEE
jgi:hypothetical protein